MPTLKDVAVPETAIDKLDAPVDVRPIFPLIEPEEDEVILI